MTEKDPGAKEPLRNQIPQVIYTAKNWLLPMSLQKDKTQEPTPMERLTNASRALADGVGVIKFLELEGSDKQVFYDVLARQIGIFLLDADLFLRQLHKPKIGDSTIDEIRNAVDSPWRPESTEDAVHQWEIFHAARTTMDFAVKDVRNKAKKNRKLPTLFYKKLFTLYTDNAPPVMTNRFIIVPHELSELSQITEADSNILQQLLELKQRINSYRPEQSS